LKPGFSHRVEFLLLWIVDLIVRFVPARSLRRLGELLGSVAFRVVPVRRTVAREGVRRAFPGLEDGEIDRIVEGSYRNLCITMLEVLKVRRMRDGELRKWVKIVGRDHLDEALGKGSGVVLVSYHMGNWELGGTILARMGYPLDVIVQRQSNPLSDEFINRIRTDAGMKIIEKDRAVTGAARSLSAKRMVAFLSDQDAGRDGVFVPFFGRPASTPKGPAVLSLRYGAPLLTTVVLRNEDGTYDFLIEPLEFERSGDLTADVFEIARRINERLEGYIADRPDQWLWQHRRWKTDPPGSNGGGRGSERGGRVKASPGGKEA